MEHGNAQAGRSHFWRRLGAIWIDTSVVYGIVSFSLSAGALLGVRWPLEASFAAVAAAYGSALLAWRGQTVGKALLGPRVVAAGDERLTARGAIVREAVGKWLLGVVTPLVCARLAVGQGWVLTVYDLLVLVAMLVPLSLHFAITRHAWYEWLAGTRVVAISRVDSKPTDCSPEGGPSLNRRLVAAAVLGAAALTLIAHALDAARLRYLPTRLAIFQDGRSLKPHVNFLESQKTPPVDYVLRLFEDHDIVVLCERLHPEATQWDFIYELVSDPRFHALVGNVFTEYGSRAQQAHLDSLLAAGSLSDDEIATRARHLLRNPSVWPTWTNTNFYTYLIRLYHLNQSLPPASRVRHHLTDQHVVWNELRDDGYRAYREGLVHRDHDMAQTVIDEVRHLRQTGDPRQKALVVMNYRHAFQLNGVLPHANTMEFLAEAFPRRTANVLINTDMILGPLTGGVWDSAFEALGNPPTGFSLASTPFGRDAFDLFPFVPRIKGSMRYADVFTGYVFVNPLTSQYREFGIPGFFDDFGEEAVRRAFLLGDARGRQMQSAVERGHLNTIRREEMGYRVAQTSGMVALLILLAPGWVLGIVRLLSTGYRGGS